MTAIACRYDRDEGVIWVGDRGRLWVGENGGLIGSRQAVEDGSLASLRHAVHRADYELGLGADVSLTLYDVSEDDLRRDDEAFKAPPFDLTVLTDRCLVTCTQVAALGSRFDRFELTAQLSPVLKRRRLTVVDFSVYEERAFTVVYLTSEIRGRGRTLGDAAASADDLLALWDATLGGGLIASTALDLLRTERPELLVGQPESSWLEAKREPYRLEEPEQQLELAKDVAALCNTGDGGILVVGLSTTKRDGRDVISNIRPIPFARLDPARYRRTIDRFVYPPPEGLTIELVAMEPDKGLLVIGVPEQSPEIRPLLVLGAVVGKKVSGSYVSVVRRRGDVTTVVHPAAIHSLLAAGQVALAGLWPNRAERSAAAAAAAAAAEQNGGAPVTNPSPDENTSPSEDISSATSGVDV